MVTASDLDSYDARNARGARKAKIPSEGQAQSSCRRNRSHASAALAGLLAGSCRVVKKAGQHSDANSFDVPVMQGL